MLEMRTRWHSVLLLDKADVFLEERCFHELERNKLVSMFLRGKPIPSLHPLVVLLTFTVFEYFEGTMFLTTNRAGTFDLAFVSRIHISPNYKELSVSSRRTVWRNFFVNSPQEHVISTKQVDELVRLDMSGRQINNVLKIARGCWRRGRRRS